MRQRTRRLSLAFIYFVLGMVSGIYTKWGYDHEELVNWHMPHFKSEARVCIFHAESRYHRCDIALHNPLLRTSVICCLWLDISASVVLFIVANTLFFDHEYIGRFVLFSNILTLFKFGMHTFMMSAFLLDPLNLISYMSEASSESIIYEKLYESYDIVETSLIFIGIMFLAEMILVLLPNTDKRFKIHALPSLFDSRIFGLGQVVLQLDCDDDETTTTSLTNALSISMEKSELLSSSEEQLCGDIGISLP